MKKMKTTKKRRCCQICTTLIDKMKKMETLGWQNMMIIAKMTTKGTYPEKKDSKFKKNKKKKTSSLTVDKTPLKETRIKKICTEDIDETLDTSYNKDAGKDEGMTVDSELSTPDPPNTGQVIERDDETETTEKIL